MDFRIKLLALLITGSVSVSLAAQTDTVTFDVKTLEGLGYTHEVADFFSQGTRFLPGENTVKIQVNGARNYTADAYFNAEGELCVNNKLLSILKLRQDPLASDCTDITTLWPEANVKLIPGQLRLEITVPEDAVDPKLDDYTRGGYAVLLNYNVFGQQFKNRQNETRLFQGLFEPGINVGNWVIRNRSNFSSGLNGDTFTSEETSALRAIESLKSLLQVGQFGVQGGSYSGLPITGAQLYSDNDQNQASQLLIPIQGIAETNATVEVRQRGRLLYRTIVPAGPFTLSHINGLSGGVPVDVDVIEENGTQQRFSLANVADIAALQTTRSYQFALGKYRPYAGEGHDIQSPMLAMAQSNFSIGRDKNLMAAGLLSGDYQNATVRGSYTGSEKGWLAGGMNYACARNTQQGVQAEVQGQLSLGSNLSVSLSTLYRSRDYLTADEALGYDDTQWQQDRNPMRTTTSTSLSWSDVEWGAYSYTFSRNDYHRGGSDYVHSFSTGHRLGRASLNMTLQTTSNGNRSVYAGISLALGSGSLNTRYQSYAGSSTLGTTYRNTFGNNGSYSIGASSTEQQQRINGSLNMRTAYSQLGASASQSTTQSRSLSLSAMGGIALANGMVATTPQPIGDTLAVVTIADQGNLRIQAPGSGITLTNHAGRAVIPKVQPYAKLKAQVDTKTLPLNIRLDSTTFDLELARGTVANRNLGVTMVRQLLLTIRNQRGETIALGSSVVDTNGKFIASVVGDGNVMLTNDLIGMPLRIKIANASECRVDYPVPERFDPEALYEEADATCR
jgi:outer membrane usher protein FimD/PapC